MNTIYIPRADYTQRADDEGNDFHAYRTIYAAAGKWVATGRQWDVGPGDEVLAFAERTGDDVHLSIIAPDEDMEGLYPAAALPFTIKPYRAEPGDWVAVDVDGAIPRRVLDVQPDGSVDFDIHGSTGRIAPGDTSWRTVPAPTRTYTVTVSADHDGAAVLDALMALSGDATVDPA